MRSKRCMDSRTVAGLKRADISKVRRGDKGNTGREIGWDGAVLFIELIVLRRYSDMRGV